METLGIYPRDSKILIVGPYPPPLGGISVHLKRLEKNLTKKGYDVDLFDTNIRFNSKVKSLSKIIKFLKLIKMVIISQYDIVHIQYLYRGYIFIFDLLRKLKGFKLFFTDHNPRLFDNSTNFSLYFKKRFIRRLDYLILVADHILEKYIKSNVKLPNNFLMKNAFLPPDLEEEDRIFRSYSQETKYFIYRHQPLIIANAWKIKFYKNMDLYGLDLCIELSGRLKKNFPDFGFLFALANQYANVEYFMKMNDRINDLGIKENFHFMTDQKELWPLSKRADLSIRPTATDGDAISIRESLYFKCPVIASDIITRPEGTIVFKSRDIDELHIKAINILQKNNNVYRN